MQQDLGKHRRVVVLGVARGVDERQRSLACEASQLADSGAPGTELLDVAAAKLAEAARVVPEPPPEPTARCQVTLPGVEARLLARPPSRPQPVDQGSMAIRGVGLLVHAL